MRIQAVSSAPRPRADEPLNQPETRSTRPSLLWGMPGPAVGFWGRTLEDVMQIHSASEARLYRRCSFAALAILLGSIAGERVFNADEPARCGLRRPSLEWNVTLPA